MAFVFSNCGKCSSKYRTKRMMKRRDKGMYEGHLVTETYYTCPTCNHDNQVFISHPLISKAYDKAFIAELNLHSNRFTDDYDKYVEEFDKANKELENKIQMIMRDIINGN